ncbi:hypothetical protein FA15DRAFT_665603 [Coprinopsis marcescibilis]|uniref:LsmAD domain-containing protein n=1 Tax=Coprinopsis marcescibilis TaxID=230819 RepID=A0A5C3LHW5_COPMA|nr:hypothetical protein FA15DRAFT_665603 [Coprinopsis marcescibilis]
MASTARQNKPVRKGGPEPVRRPPAWTGARASPTFSPSNTPRPQNPQSPNSASTFPSLGHANGNVRVDPQRDRVLHSLAGLTGTTVVLTTKTGQRYEGVVASTASEGDTSGATLKDVKDVANPGAPLKDHLFIPSTNIDSYTSGPADSKPTNGDSFRTDVEISAKRGVGRERELQAWVPSGDGNAGATLGDEDTFGPNTGSGAWDQFTANETLFGVKASFDEDVYTTRIDRNAPDFKERERNAQRIANEIMGTTTNNPHVAEERGLVDDSGINEEDKYGAVVRGAGAYVPPGARSKTGNIVLPGPPVQSSPNPEIPKVSVNGPDGTVAPAKIPSPAPGGAAPNVANKPPADPLPAFRDFVTNEKQRLNQKRQALVKSEMEKRMAELVKFSQNFKLNKPMPDDLVSILAKDEDKQKAIREKASKDAASAQARVIGASTPATASRGVLNGNKLIAKPTAQIPASKTVTGNLSQQSSTSSVQKTITNNAAASSSASGLATAPKPADGASATTKKISMVIQTIPPFKGSKPKAPVAAGPGANGAQAKPSTPASGSSGGVPLSPATAANRLNVNAPSFRTTKQGSASPSLSAASASVSPKPPKNEVTPHNPFFGTRPIKKSTPVNVKDDFNPFKHNKVVDASQVSAMWPYSGKRYVQLYPPPQHPQAQHQPHMPPPPVPTPMPQQSYDEDPAAQQAAAASRGYVYAYPHYGYPGQQHMMPGMPPPGPPGAYMQGHYMQPMPYPPGMPPPNAMYSPAMGQMPPPQAYMPPPGAYPPPPNGSGPRPSMPPTPIPSHAHPYYHQSPQMQHAVPYPMMMPPPAPPHPYDGSAPPPVPMGGHA